MGQFKPMVKMETTEPTVELKLKKGGHVKMPKQKAESHGGGHKKMADGGAMQMLASTPAMVGRPAVNAPVKSPGKPSMAARRKAMMAAPAPVMKEGGKAKHEDAAEDRAMIKKALAGKKYATGGVVEGQGGYKKGGVIAANGIIKSEKGETKVDTAKPDSVQGPTGGVKDGNGGGYRKGGAAKKFANGGSVQDDGRAIKMPQGSKRPSSPVSINQLSGTFKKGGKVKKYADGSGVTSEDMAHASARESQGYKKFYDDEKAENEATRNAMMNAIAHPIETAKKIPGKIVEGFNALRGNKGSITDTKSTVSRTIVPGKKRGGSAC